VSLPLRGRSSSSERSADPAVRPYEDLCEHAELELELVGRGEVTRLAALGARWREIAGALPPVAPPGAEELLKRTRVLHERSRAQLLALREATMEELAIAARARRTADGYAGPLRRRSPRVDRSA
jgi:hypothetical protein